MQLNLKAQLHQEALHQNLIKHMPNAKHMKTIKEWFYDIELATFKILLLGYGSSGKTTIFRQLQNIFGEGFDERKNIIVWDCLWFEFEIYNDKFWY